MRAKMRSLIVPIIGHDDRGGVLAYANTAAVTAAAKRPPAQAQKKLTRAQKLAKALKACKKDKGKAKRKACEKKARKRVRQDRSNTQTHAAPTTGTGHDRHRDDAATTGTITTGPVTTGATGTATTGTATTGTTARARPRPARRARLGPRLGHDWDRDRDHGYRDDVRHDDRDHDRAPRRRLNT